MVVFFLVALCALAAATAAGNAIVFTANQEFLSRIYVLEMDGSVHHYFEYEFYRFCDMDVVQGELYVAEAFAPRVLKVDLETGDLDVIVDDWWLYYFYGLAFDGTYFYVDEWDLNRYEIDGSGGGMASFDETVYGAAWDGTHYWTLGDEDVVKCWDISGWPALVAVPDLDFTPPSPVCHGLWFDGEYFWSAEGVDGELGYIYQFDDEGAVQRQWVAPAYAGWGACVVDGYLTGIDPVGEAALRLAPASPNPFSSTTTLRFFVPRRSRVTLSIYNVAGQLVDTPVKGELGPGDHVVEWDGSDLASGVYLCRLSAGGEAVSGKILRTK